MPFNAKLLHEENGSEYSYEELTDHLVQVVVSNTEDEIRNKKLELEKLTAEILTKKKKLKEVSDRNNTYKKELARQKQLGRVISLIATLIREGAIKGKEKIKTINLLKNIDSLNFFELRNKEESLSLLRK